MKKKLLTKFFPSFLKKIKKEEDKGSGFTLIDMMVTLSLFALLTTVLISSYPDSATKVELANAVSDVQGVVRDSQLRATTNDSSDGNTGGYGLYFDPATTTSFVQFKDISTATSSLPGQLLPGDDIFGPGDQVSKTTSVPDGFYLRNVCVANSSARPFATTTCTRTNPTLSPCDETNRLIDCSVPAKVSVVYPRGSLQPVITVLHGNQTLHYSSACFEFASVKSIDVGKVKNLIISQSGFTATSLGACDEGPLNLTVGTGDGSVGVTGIIPFQGSNDTTPPVITLYGGEEGGNNQDVTVTQSTPFVDPGATAFDNVDGNITSKIVSAVDSFQGTSTPKVSATVIDTNTIGTYVKHYTVSDRAGNRTTVYRNVLVLGPPVNITPDTTPPTVSLLDGDGPGNSTVTISQGSTYTDPGATAFDNVDGNITANIASGIDSVTSTTTVQDTYFTLATSTGESWASILNLFYWYPVSLLLNNSGEVMVVTNKRIGKVGIDGTFTKYRDNSIGLRGVVSDQNGNVYTSNSLSNTVTKITPAGVSTTLGTTGSGPSAIAVDASGNVYTANANSNNVTKITPAGVSTTLGTTGSGPSAIAVDANGNVYTANYSSSNVTKITPAGVSTIIGTTTSGSYGIAVDTSGNVYATNYSSKSVSKITPAGVSTVFGRTALNPRAIAVDTSGNVYTANYGANNVSKLTPDGVDTVLGTTGTYPYGIALDTSGNVYTANYGSNNVTKITPEGISSTLGTTANAPYGIALDVSGNVYTANANSNNVTKITPTGVSSILATLGTGDNADSVALDASDNVYVANGVTNTVTKITPAGVSTTLGTTGSNPQGIALDASGNVYTANYSSSTVTKITPAGVSTTLGTTGSGPLGIAVDASGNVYTSNILSNNVTKITPAGVSSTLGTTGSVPRSIALDASGNVYTANYSSSNVTKITPAGVSSTLGTIGSGSRSIALAASGDVYIPSYLKSVNKITPAGVSTTFATTTSPALKILISPYGKIVQTLDFLRNIEKQVVNTASTTTLDTNTVGIYTKHYTVTDAAGNTTTVYRTIKVQ